MSFSKLCTEKVEMNCLVCTRVLKKSQKKYCGDSCYKIMKSEEQKLKYRKHNPLLPKRLCLLCQDSFQPFGQSHKCCDTVCRNLYEAKKQREKTKSRSTGTAKLYSKFWLPIATKSKCKGIPDSTINKIPTDNSPHKKEIQSFKKAGGTITRLPDQLNGRTPDVSTRSRYGWSTDSMMGFGFELDLMEQLIEFSESADEI
jgi:predicted nucleic acid-binding Zn ribbon protein